MRNKKVSEPEVVFSQWRTKILNGILIVLSVVAAPAWITTIIEARDVPERIPIAVLLSGVYATVLLLTILRRLDGRIRAWGLLIVGYIAAISILVAAGIDSAGPWYAMALPIVGFILVGVRSGVVSSILSAVILAVTTILIDLGILLPMESTLMSPWVGYSTLVMLLGLIMALLILYRRFQVQLIQNERQAQGELLQAHALLEQKVKERTEELERSNKVQSALFKISDAANDSPDMQEFYERVHQIIGELMYARNMFIALYDESTRVLSFPYFIDEVEKEAPPAAPLGTFYGLTAYIIRTGEMIKHGREQFNQLLASGEVKQEGPVNEDGIGAPLKVEGKTLGVIFVQSYTPGIHYTDQDDEILAYVAQHLATALSRIRALEAERQRAAELAIINSVQAGLASQLDMQALYELVGEKIREIFEANTVVLATFDVENNLMYRHYTYEKGVRYNFEPMPISANWLQFIQGDRSALINTGLREFLFQLDPDFKVPAGEIPKSALSVPLRLKGGVKGVISLQNVDHENAFCESDQRLLETLANSLSVALENARLFEETQRLLKETEQRNNELAILYSLAEAMSETLDVKTVTKIVGDKIREIFKADSAMILLLDKQTNLIHTYYEYDENEGGYTDFIEPIPLGKGLSSKVIISRQPLLLGTFKEAIDNDAYFPPRTIEQGSTAWSESWLGVPIMVSDEVLGLVALADAESNAFNENHKRLLQTLSSNLGVAIANARLFEAVQQRAAELAAINTVSAAITSELDLDALISLVGEQMRSLFLAEIAYVALVDEDSGIINFPYTYGEELTPIKVGEGLTSKIIKTNQPILINQKMDDQVVEIGATLVGKRSLSYLGVPIVVRGNAVGVLSVQSTSREDVFDESDSRLLSTIATSVGTALHNAQLFKDAKRARADAEHANAAKSVFLANMSHELRTPLNAIIGFTRIVRRKAEGVLPEKQTENLDKVMISAEHLLNLINTILDIAKIEAGRMDVLAANFRIGALMDLCINTAQPLLRPKVALEKHLDESITTINSDQDKIRQIVLNLLSNAAKFTHEGKITLSTERCGKDKLRISVSDTGIGISTEALPLIFKEFQQADNSTTRQYGGTGLGLSISRNLAYLLGGDLTVVSESGKGSTFTLTIPLQYKSKTLMPEDVRPYGSSAIHREEKLETGECVEPEDTKKRILVIDNDPDAVYLLQESLNQDEFEIFGTRSGQEGIQLARQQQPQAILLDILLPGMDGWQVLHDLKEDSSTSNIPVVLLTIVDKKALGFRLGAEAYLLKPLDPKAVRDTLDRVIGSKGSRQTRVLLIDDDPNIADMLRQYLPESNYLLDSALDGLAGLEAVNSNRPDIILLDLIMPRLDGFGVIERLRADPHTCDLPIIVISAKDLTQKETKKLKETVTTVMKKQGFQGEELAEEIIQILENA